MLTREGMERPQAIHLETEFLVLAHLAFSEVTGKLSTKTAKTKAYLPS